MKKDREDEAREIMSHITALTVAAVVVLWFIGVSLIAFGCFGNRVDFLVYGVLSIIVSIPMYRLSKRADEWRSLV